MANITTEIVPTIEEPREKKDNHISVEESKTQIVTALNMLDTMHKENINTYAKKLHDYTRKIEDKKSQLTPLYKEMEPHKEALDNAQKEVDYMLRALENLTEKWCQKSMVISELDSELSNLEYSSNEREQILKHRNQTVKEIDFEIEEIELLLLKYELEKQNILLFIEPIGQKIIALKQSIKELEAEKRYIEASQLHTLSSNTIKNINKALPHS